MATQVTVITGEGSTSYSVSTGSRGPTGAAGTPGSAGSTGATGAQGDRAGLKYTFDDQTTPGAPSPGHLKFNSSTLSAVTRISIRDTDFDGSNTSALLALIDGSTSTIKARVVIRSNSNADASHFNFLVTSVTDEGNHHHINGTYVSGSAFTANEIVTFDFYQTGDKGEQGTTGAAGAAGDTSIIPIETVSTTTRTVTPSDTGKKLRLTNASGCAITIQLDATAAFTLGHILYFRRVTGAGVPTIVSNGVTINNSKLTSIFEGDDFALQNVGVDTFDFT